MSAVILDTETTGVDAPDVIELAWLGPLEVGAVIGKAEGECQRYRPTKPITLGAMATHGIIPADLEDCPPWAGWQAPAGVEYLIGHSVDFDWQAIGSPPLKRICTLALARQVWPQLDSHSLSATMYFMYDHRHARRLVQRAHSAAADVQLCHHLLGRLWMELAKPASWEQLWQLSEVARVPTTMPFGKHKGLAICDVPRDYVRWLLGQPDIDPYVRKAFDPYARMAFVPTMRP